MNTVIVGAQWGDEGKGKIVDFLAESADIVIRYSGGANAGHTVVVNGETFKLHLVPSGIIHPQKQAVLGIGMVIDPQALFEELATLEKQGITWKDRLFVSDRAHIVFPEYKEKDREMDKSKMIPIGTTGRGIGISYALKAYRDGIRMVDIFDPEIFRIMPESKKKFIQPYMDRLRSMLVDVSVFLYDNKSKNIIFEGAQGTLLDINLGTYPYVSSGISSASGAAIGGGLGPKDLGTIVGVFKAYTTRVGNGPLPTEFTQEHDGELGDQIRELGREYGVTTGRPRRCGFLDLVALEYACRINSIDYLALTHLDVYDQMDTVKVCTNYLVDGNRLDHFPASISQLQSAVPEAKVFKGWKRSLKNCRRYEDLPTEAQHFVTFIEEFTRTPINLFSVGYNREETFVRDKGNA